MKKLFCIAHLCLVTYTLSAQLRWPAEKASQWYTAKGWLIGCNYINESSANQFEMWQEATFKPAEIDKELGWAEDLGFNSMRVFLHYKLWVQDSAGFKNRINTYLTIADKHRISTMFVLFDDCWVDSSRLGTQPQPLPGRHNSRWLRCPGKEYYQDSLSLTPVLERYTKDILSSFANDKRIVVWDLYNEPGNSGRGIKSLALLRLAFEWARKINPTQPLTAGIWNTVPEYGRFVILQKENSDVITFHHYGNMTMLKDFLPQFQEKGRPLICTEYMARTKESFFQTHLPYFKKQKIGAYNWGFVQGKTQTHISWEDTSGLEPKVWFHDILRADGKPYDAKETTLIHSLSIKK